MIGYRAVVEAWRISINVEKPWKDNIRSCLYQGSGKILTWWIQWIAQLDSHHRWDNTLRLFHHWCWPKLQQEHLEEMAAIACTEAVMIIWDNLNIAFNIIEQCHDLKVHFDSGMTATLIPLFRLEFDGLPLDLLPHHNNHLPLLSFGPEDWRKDGMSRMASFGISKTFSIMHFLIFVTAFTMTLKQCPQSIRSHFKNKAISLAWNADWWVMFGWNTGGSRHHCYSPLEV